MTTQFQRRRLFVSFLRRELVGRYSGTIFGGVWAIAQPLLMLAIYSFVFRLVFKVGFAELGEHSFTAFVACALWPWMAFQEGIQRATMAIAGNAGLIRKIAFPHEMLVFASVAATFLTHSVGFIVVAIALFVTGEPIYGSGIAVAAIGWIVLFLLAMTVGFATSALQVFLKDIDHLLGPVLMVLFYITPVLYPLAQVPTAYRDLMALNPLVHILEPIRNALLDGASVGNFVTLLTIFVAVSALFAIAWALFHRLSRSFDDFV